MEEAEKLERAISALETQRTVLGDEIVDMAIGPLREKLASLRVLASHTQVSHTEEMQQRRIISILFADVSGFTALSEQLDAEDVRDTMNALWERLDAVILLYGGKIDKHMGDGVMALWGADEAREDDPERAIHAALSMQAELASFRPALQIVPALKMRIGLNTGAVLLGVIGTRGEITAMGDTVNLAARLEQVCQPGSILISHDTYRHVRGVFDVEPQLPLEIRGKSEPVLTYRVYQAKPRAFRLYTRGVEGVETRMVGREVEMARLQEIFNYALLGQHLHVVTVLGDAGLGKSRLLYEFNSWAELQSVNWWWFKGRASLSMIRAPYALLRDIFAFRFEIKDSDPLTVAHSKMEAGFRQFLPGDDGAIEKAHVVGHLLGLNFASSPYLRGLLHDPRQLRQQALFYITHFFRAVAAQRPILMMLDDIQWADTGSLDALSAVFQNLPLETPFMVLSVARPVLSEHYPRWGQNLPAYARITLNPLTKDDSRRLVDEILRKVFELPASVRELVVSGAEGNPFYLEELIKMLIDSKVIRPSEEVWSVDPSRLATVRVPPTLTEVLQARLDSLSTPDRTVLQRASAVGRIFWDQVLVILSEGLSEAEVLEAIASLKRKELIFERRPPAFSGMHEYTFKHSLLHEVTYDTLLKRQRATYHARIAFWLDQVSGERRAEYLTQIAEHYEKGGDDDHAAAAISEAAFRALKLSALAGARSFFEHALELFRHSQKSGPEVIELEIGLSETHTQLSDYPRAQRHGEIAWSLSVEMQDDVLVAESLVRLGQVALHLGNYQSASSYLTGALYLAEKENVPGTLALVLVSLGTAEWRLGDLETGREHCLRSLQIADEIGDDTTRILALNRLGVIAGSLGFHLEAEEYCQRSLSLALSVGNRERASVALNNLGAQAGEQKQWQKAWDYYAHAYEVSQETGSLNQMSLYLINLAMAGIRLGKTDETYAFLCEGAELAQRIGSAPNCVFAIIYYALLKHAQGDVDRALELFGVSSTSPAYDSECEREIGMYLDEWQLDPARVKAGIERGKKFDLNRVLNELIKKNAPV